MTNLEELQMAHNRLRELRGGSTTGPWSANPGDFEINAPFEDGELTAVADWYKTSSTDGSLIVTLHRTIDAQLATLQWWIDWHAISPQATDPDNYVMDLARAINGGDHVHPDDDHDHLESLAEVELGVIDSVARTTRKPRLPALTVDPEWIDRNHGDAINGEAS